MKLISIIQIRAALANLIFGLPIFFIMLQNSVLSSAPYIHGCDGRGGGCYNIDYGGDIKVDFLVEIWSFPPLKRHFKINVLCSTSSAQFL